MENMPDNINYCNNRKDFYLDNAGNLCRNEKHPEKDPDQSTELNTKCQKKKTKKTLQNKNRQVKKQANLEQIMSQEYRILKDPLNREIFVMSISEMNKPYKQGIRQLVFPENGKMKH